MKKEKLLKEFEEKFLDKWLPPRFDALTLDGDSRSMRKRGLDLVSFIIDQAQQEGREELLKELNITKDFKLAEWKNAYQKGAKKAREELLVDIINLIKNKR
jgi:hypothetical protein